MSKKFTGVHSGGQNIPVYDKDAHSAIEQKLNTSAFQSVSGNFLTAVPESALSGYATKEYASSAANAAASGKLDTDTFSQVSGDFLTAVPQSYLQNTDLTVTSGKVTEISGIPLSAGGGTLPDTIPVSGVSGISVTETENEVLIGISADFATPADLEKKLDTSAFSSVSGNFLTAVPENYATKEYLSGQISGKYDTSSFANVSGDFLTAVPESAISGFATHEEVESAVSGKQDVSAMSAYQEKGDYYSASNPSGFLTEIPQSALSGFVHISASAVAIGQSAKAINENTFAQGTRVSADRNSLAQGVNASAVMMAFAQGNNCIASGFSIAQGAGTRASAHSLAQGSYVSANDHSIAQGESVRADDHSIAQGFYTSAYNRSQAFGFGTKASGNQMSIGIHNKTSAGAAFVIGDGTGSDQLSDAFIIWKDGSVSAKGKISANGVELGAIPEGVMQTSGLEYDGDKISGYMGSAFKAGDELPATVMDTSGLEYNSQGYINGYNGSAVATIDQERQWFTHDDTLCHVSNSAQYALGVNMSAISADLARMMGVDETVLFETTAVYGAGVCNLSESLKNFKTIKVLATRGYNGTTNPGGFAGPWSEWETDGISADGKDFNSVAPFMFEGVNWKNSMYSADSTYTTLTWYQGQQTNIITNVGSTANSFTGCVGIKKIVGIGRKN